ncbi:PRD domain-containing protein [Streptococcus himalayensis]|uniref:Transcriptional antiterminator n=1 Tax=Streptococcus himalayensis TaxID=1888195 RepID=A0A917A453_9STRE|nr:PRD domain-containing protein [Streptococcus himalayensis]GGE26032.1 transcriptional antiterminator [Streptococcus himalayensis]
MYRILQALNNNVALVKDEKDQQFVIMGLGITFQKKKGDIIVESKIEKTFSLKNSESKENFLMLLRDVPLDFITTTYDVITHVSSKYSYPVQEYVYVTLTDHIYCAYQAVLENCYQESRLPNISEEYTTEYNMAIEALEMFRKQLLLELPDDEISRIAFHFINAKGVTSSDKSLKDEATRGILDSVKSELEKNGIKRTKENSNFYDRLMIHLTYFVQYYDRNTEETPFIIDMSLQMEKAYPEAYALGNRIYHIIVSELGLEEKISEKFYIVLHIQRLL